MDYREVAIAIAVAPAAMAAGMRAEEEAGEEDRADDEDHPGDDADPGCHRGEAAVPCGRAGALSSRG